MSAEPRQPQVAVELQIPIFPLNTVLFPGGVLPLRIFEPRYMDMVRDCLRNDTGFGVCLITEGREVGRPALHEMTGCLARIGHWDMEQLGLLNIRTVGERRFSVIDTRVENDGLIRASIEWLEEEPDTEVPSSFDGCVALLRRIVDDLVEKEPDPARRMIEPPYRFESATWVSNRICEFLPISVTAKHRLMSLEDPLARLRVVSEFLLKHKVI